LSNDVIQKVTSHSAVTGLIWDIKKYPLHDGPGIRTTVFLKGCPLHCLWCCNPESQHFQPEIIWLKENCLQCNLCMEICPARAIYPDKGGEKSINPDLCDNCGLCVKQCPGGALQLAGRRVTIDEVLLEIEKDAVFYHRTGGGLTLSGGEPLAQPAFARELLRQYKISEGGLHTAIETCGHADWQTLAAILEYTDLFLYDIKHMDPGEHRRLTGVSNALILENAKKIAAASKKLIIRLPLIPGYNDSEENISKTAAFAGSLPGVEELDILPYHRLGEPKYKRLGKRYCLTGTGAFPQDRLGPIRGIIENYGLRVRIGG